MIKISFEKYSNAKDHFNDLLSQLKYAKENHLEITEQILEFAVENLREAYEILGIHMEP